jgi:hypothetical protein
MVEVPAGRLRPWLSCETWYFLARVVGVRLESNMDMNIMQYCAYKIGFAVFFRCLKLQECVCSSILGDGIMLVLPQIYPPDACNQRTRYHKWAF